ncbi:cytochrome P450 [Kitasatospora sp. NPDC096147]|uniref:cytochrome P450 n=1 Tax=Kitasatospora sp. NPDC096147 TaxID=3364093 RepID=UPI003803CF3C
MDTPAPQQSHARPAPTELPAATGRCPFDPLPAYREADRVAPVTEARLWDGTTCHLLTGYQEVRAAFADKRFSADARHPGFPFLSPGRRELTNRTTPSFIRLDDPEHARQRRLLTGDFIIKRVEAMRPEIQRIVDETLDRMIAGGGPADLVTAFALPVPSLVICLLLGVPYEDHDFFQQQSRKLLDLTSDVEEVSGAVQSLTDYLTGLAESKQREPDGGLLSRLVARDEVTLDEAAAMGLLLLVAGHETTANMTALGTLALLRHPEQAELWRREPELTNGAVEELLRYLTIIQHGLPRVALEDIEIGGTRIRAGEGVILMLSTANRDEELFADPDTLDLTREARRHLAFGFGVHQCLGQPLARFELRIALSTLLRRLPTLRLAVPFEELKYRDSSAIHGLQELPVTW